MSNVQDKKKKKK
jgi:hypothetical protein